MLGDDDDEFYTAYFCFRCMAVRWGCAEADAIVLIRDGRRDVKRRREQNAAFNAAAATVVAAVPGITKGQRRVLAVDYLKEAMSPLVRFVRIKTKMLRQRSLLLEENSALIVRMRDALQLRDVLDLIPQLDAIENEVDLASEPIAFRGRGDDQWAFWRRTTRMSGASSAGLMGPYNAPSAATTVAGVRQGCRTGAVAL